MKIFAAIKSVFASIAVVLLSTIGLAGHASAISVGSHEMSGMHHESSDAVSCMVQCQTGVVASEDKSDEKEKNRDDDEPAPPRFPESQQVILGEKLVAPQQNALEAAPPEPPGYILYGVFRT